MILLNKLIFVKVTTKGARGQKSQKFDDVFNEWPLSNIVAVCI